jgi:hypothetical protein
LLLFSSLALAGTGDDLAAAMDVPTADINTASLAAGTANMVEVSTGKGTISAQQGNDFAWLYTGQIGIGPESGTDMGQYGTNGDRATLALDLHAPSTANSLVFDFFFLSAEYPEYVGSNYNDTFEANINGSAWSGNAAIDSQGNGININTVLFAVTNAGDLAGTGFQNVGGGTGWLSVVVPVDPSTDIDLVLTVYDVYDGILDSAVALDDFYWSESDIDVPTIIKDIDVDFLSPKAGGIDGGDPTTVYGSGFSQGCTAWFDGVEAVTTTFVDDASLIAVPAPHAEGLVDVEIKCVGATKTLAGGYSFYDESEGLLPPIIYAVDPYNISVEGGDTLTITGDGFQAGAKVVLDGEQLVTSFLDEFTLVVTARPHDAGLVDITVNNPDGMSDTLSGAVQYVGLPDTGGVEGADSGLLDSGIGGGVDNTPGSADKGCSTTSRGPVAAAWLLGLFGLILRRRA